MSVQQIIDPTVSSASSQSASAAARDASPRAAGVATLDGVRVGVLENTKRNAAQILDAVAEELGSRYKLSGVVRRTKKQFAMPFTEEQLEDLRSEVDVVVIGVGDCGSCSAAAVADGIALEEIGIPTAVINTDAFEGNSRAMAKLKGNAEFDFLITSHPVANLDATEVNDRGRSLVDDVIARLVEAEPASEIR